MNTIETHKLTRKFGNLVAVDNLTLSIPEGTVFGFLGPNGAGKTTTVRMLTALIAPTSGTANVIGHELGIGNQSRLYDVPAQRAQEQAERYLRMLELWERRSDRVGGFSKGMRQKLAIARALLHEPRVIFLDEPTAGLDPEAARTVRDFIKELRSEGRTIFLTTHNLPEADELCDLIGVFRTQLLRVDTPVNLRTGLFGRGTQVRVVGDASGWASTARSLSFVRQVTSQDDRLLVTLDNPDEQNPQLVQALVTAGAQIRFVEPIAHSLEEVYLELIEDAPAAAVQN